MSLSRILLIVMRAGAAILVVLGVAFWTGHWSGLVGIHQAVGMLFVLALWIIAVIALAGRRNIGLAVFALVWGAIVAGLGMSQVRILTGDLHWIIRVLHLVIGLAAMPIAERLTKPVPVVH